jgi:hypothetical protein
MKMALRRLSGSMNCTASGDEVDRIQYELNMSRGLLETPYILHAILTDSVKWSSEKKGRSREVDWKYEINNERNSTLTDSAKNPIPTAPYTSNTMSALAC